MELLHGGVYITSVNPENHRKVGADAVHVHDWFRFEYGLDEADRSEQDRSWVEAGRRVRQDQENCKNPPDLGLGPRKTTRFEETFKNPPIFMLTVATGADRPD
jgi:hypothetical protein